MNGETYLSPPIAGSIVDDFFSRSDADEESGKLEKLTPRETEVLQLLAEGGTNNSIAEEFVISAKTVEKHRASLMSKLDIHDLAGLVRFAVKHGLVSVTDWPSGGCLSLPGYSAHHPSCLLMGSIPRQR